MFPTDKNAQESFQSARVPVSQAGTRSDCVWTSETRNGVKTKVGGGIAIILMPLLGIPLAPEA